MRKRKHLPHNLVVLYQFFSFILVCDLLPCAKFWWDNRLLRFPTFRGDGVFPFWQAIVGWRGYEVVKSDLSWRQLSLSECLASWRRRQNQCPATWCLLQIFQCDSPSGLSIYGVGWKKNVQVETQIVVVLTIKDSFFYSSMGCLVRLSYRNFGLYAAECSSLFPLWSVFYLVSEVRCYCLLWIYPLGRW